jgi:D-alanyl-D-alanine carboxypeptidase
MKYWILGLAILYCYNLNGQHLQENVLHPFSAESFFELDRPGGPQVTIRSGIDPLLAARLQDTIEIYRDMFNSVGLSAALILPDGEVWNGASGLKSFPALLLEPSNALGVGSVSKTLTAAAIMKLWDMGKLNPNDPLSAHIGNYPNISGSITLQQCLQHTSGLADYTANPLLGEQINSDPAKFWSPEELLQNFVLAPLAAPGVTWNYCNTNYLILGKVIEVASGMPYHEFVREELLQPLGLDSITLGEYEVETYERAHVWADAGFGKVDIVQFGFSLTGLFSSAWSAGAYWSTATDIAFWMRSLLEGQVLSANALNTMKDVLEITPEVGYGAGLIRYRIGGINAWGHGGNILYKSIVLHIPELGISVAVIGNDNDFVGEGPTALALVQGYLDFISTSVVNSDMESNISIYPNPLVSESVITGLSGVSDITLTDLQGRVLIQSQVLGTKKGMPVEAIFQGKNVPNGLYYLSIISEKETRILPITLMR